MKRLLLAILIFPSVAFATQIDTEIKDCSLSNEANGDASFHGVAEGVDFTFTAPAMSTPAQIEILESAKARDAVNNNRRNNVKTLKTYFKSRGKRKINKKAEQMEE
jgi:hypothetical protein